MTVQVRQGDSLPVPSRDPAVTATRGYAVRHEGPTHASDWLFFEHLEPAWAYGRAAGMSSLTSRWTIRRAALVVTVDPVRGQDTLVLHLAGLVPWNAEGAFDARTLARWLEGISGSATQWQPLR